LRAVVISPGPPGRGGQGKAAGDMATALRDHGLDTAYVTLPTRPSPLRRLLTRRVVRRFSRAALNELDRREVGRRVPGGWDLAYAMPGFLPAAGGGVRIIHQAARPGAVDARRMAEARRLAGGGAIDHTRLDVARWRREAERADLFRAESALVARDLEDMGVDPARVVRAPPGVDLVRHRPAAKPARARVAFVGPLSLRKGVDIVLDFNRRTAGDVDLVVVGGPTDPWSRRIAARLRAQRGDDVATELARSHVLLLPSASDGFAYTVLEAMACGCVPIVTPDVGAAELVEQVAGELVQPRAAFAEAAARLVAELPLARLAERARELAEDYDVDRRSREAAAALLARARERGLLAS
jgi:glycosyltransferase involved in cell wall biosynthesis